MPQSIESIIICSWSFAIAGIILPQMNTFWEYTAWHSLRIVKLLKFVNCWLWATVLGQIPAAPVVFSAPAAATLSPTSFGLPPPCSLEHPMHPTQCRTVCHFIPEVLKSLFKDQSCCSEAHSENRIVVLTINLLCWFQMSES